VGDHESVVHAVYQAHVRRVALRPAYRVRQFLAALYVYGKKIDRSALEAHLNPAQVELFERMTTSEQRHGLAVLRTLQRDEQSVPALMQAALLHDVGKAEGHVHLWHRVTTVLLCAVSPQLLQRLALDQPNSWRYPFFVQLQHASLGAELAARAGSDARTVELIRWHHSAPQESSLHPAEQMLLAALQAADEQN